MFAAFPSTIMEAAFGASLHKDGAGRVRRRPIFVDSIVVGGEAKNIATTHGTMYELFVDLNILLNPTNIVHRCLMRFLLSPTSDVSKARSGNSEQYVDISQIVFLYVYLLCDIKRGIHDSSLQQGMRSRFSA